MAMIDDALYLIEHNFAIFPLRENRKDPAVKGGFTSAFTDKEHATAVWSRMPNLNIGIATGGMSGGIVVIDCDYHPEDGRDGLSVKAEWEREHGDFPETVCVETPTGGEHYYFRTDEPFSCSTNSKAAIDIRGDGGYVVAPPSIHPNGGTYAWIDSPDETPIADIDENVKAFIRSVQGDAERKPPFEVPETIGKGERNNVLFKLACSMQSKGYTDEEIAMKLHGVNSVKCKPPLSAQEVTAIIQQATNYDKGEKKDAKKRARLSHNDFGKLLIEHDHACFIDGAPAVYDGQRYATGWAAVQRAMLRHQDNVKQSDQREICHYLTLTAPDREAAEPCYIGFANGVFDMHGDGTLQPFTPDMVITNVVPHEYDPDAYDEVTDAFLDSIACGNIDVRANLEEVIGLCIYRSNEYGVCPILLGEGSNGKSTFITALRNVLGTDNTSSLDLGVIGKQFQTGRLLGKLANLGDDISNEFLRGDTLAVFKKVVTGERVYTDVKGTDGYEFRPYCTLVFSANEMPTLGDFSKGMLRRLFPIPFDAVFSPSEPGYDPRIAKKLCTERAASYLCKLGVNGLQRVIAQNGMSENARSREMVREVQLLNDNVAAWIDETALELDGIIGHTTAEVYNRYSDWCDANGAKRLTQKRFGQRLSRAVANGSVPIPHGGVIDVRGTCYKPATNLLQGCYITTVPTHRNGRSVREYTIKPIEYG